MSHKSVITDLKKLLKQGLMSTDPSKLVRYWHGESDRTLLILTAASLEETILYRLKQQMPNLNADERDRIFSFEGPCGSFSNRLRMAHGLDIIDRPTRRHLEVMKELRNVAAHAHAELYLDTPEIHRAVASFFDPKAQADILTWNRGNVRTLYIMMTARLGLALSQGDKVKLSAAYEWTREKMGKRETSPKKSQSASPRKGPAKAKTGGRP